MHAVFSLRNFGASDEVHFMFRFVFVKQMCNVKCQKFRSGTKLETELH